MYRALYRKWRPRTFADVIGQDAIVQALKNQVETGHIGHAYLFTGTRGTGKTSCAKILAKAVNCPHCSHGDPCGECEICRGVEDGSLLDVEEIDAASNNGVDNVRSLREDAVYAPTMGRYKVYIIDEVHMLSPAAFNALLKITEEPPAHLIFILATTELHKVPVTVLSRCQRYDFMRIGPQDIAGRLQYVAEQEKIDLTPEAALLLGQLADGAMRDALSLLDTCSGIGGTVDEALVRRVAGVTDKQYLFDISHAAASGDIEALIAALNDPRTRALDTRRLCEELIFHYRNLMLGAVSQDASLLLQVSQAQQEQYLQEGRTLPVSQAAAAIRRLGEALERMAKGSNVRIELELALFALAGAGGLSLQSPAQAVPPAAPPTVAAGMAGTAVAPFAANGGGAMPCPAAMPLQTATPVPAAQPQPPAQKAAAPQASGQPSAPPTVAYAADCTPFALWPQVQQLIGQRDIPLASFLIGSNAYRQKNRVLIEGNSMLYDYLRANKNSHANLKAALQEVTGEDLGIGPYTPPKAAAQDDPLETLRRQGIEVTEEG